MLEKVRDLKENPDNAEKEGKLENGAVVVDNVQVDKNTFFLSQGR